MKIIFAKKKDEDVKELLETARNIRDAVDTKRKLSLAVAIVSFIVGVSALFTNLIFDVGSNTELHGFYIILSVIVYVGVSLFTSKDELYCDVYSIVHDLLRIQLGLSCSGRIENNHLEENKDYFFIHRDMPDDEIALSFRESDGTLYEAMSFSEDLESLNDETLDFSYYDRKLEEINIELKGKKYANFSVRK